MLSPDARAFSQSVDRAMMGAMTPEPSQPSTREDGGKVTSDPVGAPAHPADLAAARDLSEVVRIFVNDSRWWQNASFALPLLVSVVTLVPGWIFGVTEAIGFGLFMAAVTLIMTPVVLLTWRSTATAIVLTRDGAYALHRGRLLYEAPWRELSRIEEVEYLGNKRYKLVHGEDDRFLSVETELDGREELVELAFELSGVPRQRASEGEQGT